MNIEASSYNEWIGRSQSSTDFLTLAPLKGLAATLDKKKVDFSPGDKLPSLWHWLYFLDPAKQSNLANDGHAERGNFLPPIPLPGRMWGGSRFEFHKPLHAGEEIQRKSTIKSIAIKEGRSGQLAFVTVSHEIGKKGEIAISEEHDIVYRNHAKPNKMAPSGNIAPTESDYAKTIIPDSILLFRYSALTFNGHRIHYDREYVTNEEGYPGLLVHGPLLATLIADLVSEQFPGKNLTRFEFKAMNPVFDLNAFHVCGINPNQNGQLELWIKDHADVLCMKASATLV